MRLLRRLFGRKSKEELRQFSGVRLSFLVIDGEEKIFDLLKKELSRRGVSVLPIRSENLTHELSFWTREMNPGLPILSGVRLILRTVDSVELGDEVVYRPFLIEEDFVSFVARWVVTCLELAELASTREA